MKDNDLRGLILRKYYENRRRGLFRWKIDDFVEIKDGVKPGDVVITSDMSEYKNSKEVTINN